MYVYEKFYHCYYVAYYYNDKKKKKRAYKRVFFLENLGFHEINFQYTSRLVFVFCWLDIIIYAFNRDPNFFFTRNNALCISLYWKFKFCLSWSSCYSDNSRDFHLRRLRKKLQIYPKTKFFSFFSCFH